MVFPPSFIGALNPSVRYPLQPAARAAAEARTRRRVLRDMSILPRSDQIDRDVQRKPDGADEVPEHPPEPDRAPRRPARWPRADGEHTERRESDEDVQRMKGGEGVEGRRVRSAARH